MKDGYTNISDMKAEKPKLGFFDFQERFQLKDSTMGALCLTAGILIQIFNGCFFLWANISIYVLSYLYHFDPTIRNSTTFYVDFALLALTVTGYNLGMYLFTTKGWSPR